MRQSKGKSNTATPKAKALTKNESTSSTKKQGTLFGFLGKKEPDPVEELPKQPKGNSKPTTPRKTPKKQEKVASSQ